VSACDLENSFGFNETAEITSHVHFPMVVVVVVVAVAAAAAAAAAVYYVLAVRL